jgi:hypothetical protein
MSIGDVPVAGRDTQYSQALGELGETISQLLQTRDEMEKRLQRVMRPAPANGNLIETGPATPPVPMAPFVLDIKEQTGRIKQVISQMRAMMSLIEI